MKRTRARKKRIHGESEKGDGAIEKEQRRTSRTSEREGSGREGRCG